MSTVPPIRERVVESLVSAIRADDEDAVAEIWLGATESEKRAAAARLGSVASLLEDRAGIFRALALKQALDLIGPYWHPGKTLGAALKTAPPGVAASALDILRRFDWLTEEEAGV